MPSSVKKKKKHTWRTWDGSLCYRLAVRKDKVEQSRKNWGLSEVGHASRKDFARSRTNIYCRLDTSNTGHSMALHNLDLNSDLISYHSQGSKNGRQEWATKRYGTKEMLKMMRNRQETYTGAATGPWLHSERRTLSAKWELNGSGSQRKQGGYRREDKTVDGGAWRVWKKEGPVNGSGVMAMKQISSAWRRRTPQGLPSGA